MDSAPLPPSSPLPVPVKTAQTKTAATNKTAVARKKSTKTKKTATSKRGDCPKASSSVPAPAGTAKTKTIAKETKNVSTSKRRDRPKGSGKESSAGTAGSRSPDRAPPAVAPASDETAGFEKGSGDDSAPPVRTAARPLSPSLQGDVSPPPPPRRRGGRRRRKEGAQVPTEYDRMLLERMDAPCDAAEVRRCLDELDVEFVAASKAAEALEKLLERLVEEEAIIRAGLGDDGGGRGGVQGPKEHILKEEEEEKRMQQALLIDSSSSSEEEGEG